MCLFLKTDTKMMNELAEKPIIKQLTGGLLINGQTAHKKKKISVLSPSKIINKKRINYAFEGRFLETFGSPEKHSKWFFTGPSYAGKSSLLFEVCNYLTNFGVIDYNNHEEAGGDSETVVKKILQSGLQDKDGRIRLFKAPIVSDDFETFGERLMKKRSADFAVIDSIQHAELSKKQYLHLTDTFCNPRRGKTLLFISHWVKNDFTKFVKHDCDVKVEVIGFVANVDSRFGGGKPFLIWEHGAKKYWGKKYNAVLQGRYWPGRKK